MILYWPYLMAFIIIATNAIVWAQDFTILTNVEQEEDREKRAIDFGLFVRNLLLKSAAASNVKSDITRNVANLKANTIAPRRRTTTTTTTMAPFFFNKGPLKFPFDLSAPFNNKINSNSNKLVNTNTNNNLGYINFDYIDYGVARQTVRPGRRRRPTTTTTTIVTTTRAPPATPTQRQKQQQPPTRRGPIPRRPYGLFGKQKVPQFQYYTDDGDDYNYDDDYDDDVDYDTNQASTTTSAPATRRPPRPPPPAKPERPPTAARTRAQGRVPQLRNRLVYKFRQPEDTSTNNNDNSTVEQPAALPAEDSTESTNSNDGEESQTENNSENDDTGNNEETPVNTNDDYTDVSVNNNDNNNTENNDAQDDYIDTNNASDDNNNNNNNNLNFNLPSFQSLPIQNQFNNPGAYYNPNVANFGPSANFQHPSYNYYTTQYQPSAPADYSLSYY